MKTTDIVRATLTQIKDAAADLNPRQARMVKNRCSKVLVSLAKIDAILGDAIDVPFHDPVDRQTPEQFETRASRDEKLWQALLKGRHISLNDQREFKLAELHTSFCYIRKRIAQHNLPFVLCDRWITSNRNTRCKEYWLIPRPEEG